MIQSTKIGLINLHKVHQWLMLFHLLYVQQKNSSMDFEAKSPEIVPDPLVNIQKAIENGH